jgi:hypothetical protein
VQAKTTILGRARLSAASGVALLLASACSGGSGTVGPEPVIYFFDSGVDGGAGSSSSGSSSSGGGGSSSGSSIDSGSQELDSSTPVDGTTGKACSTDAECTAPGGPGVNVCSIDFVTQVAGVTGASLPKAVCLIPPSQSQANCDPTSATDPQGFNAHFCDGPDEPSSPGLCVPLNPQTPAPGEGVCLPKCTFKTDGSAEVGCSSPNTCTPSVFAPGGGTALTVIGYGYCQGTCQQDSDCTTLGAGYVCQTDVGICTTQPMTRTKAIGATCDQNDYDSGACNCNYDPGTNAGFCTSTCVVGGVPCPGGWVCDDGEISDLSFSSGTVVLTTPTPGLAGVCLPACSGDGGVCPGGATCTPGTFAGPDCVP